MTERILAATERVVTRTATGITRRRLARRAGEVALGAAIAGAFLDRLGTGSALADCGISGLNCPGGCTTGPCDPAPRCGDNHCSAGGECENNDVDGHHTRSRPYGGGNCEPITNDKSNCWCTCETSTNTMHRCCDCCQENPTGSTLTCHPPSCPWDTAYKCFCSVKVADHC